MKKIVLTMITLAAVLAVGCGGEEVTAPRDKGYMRIDMPQSSYAEYDTTALPFRFELSTDARVKMLRDGKRMKTMAIEYPKCMGVVSLGYVSMKDAKELVGQIDTSIQLRNMHNSVSTGYEEQQFVNDGSKVYATVYRIKGQKVASTYQFWATDSVKHFLRGSLYIDCVPNNDSLAPVLEYLQRDVDHLVETLKWK